MPIFKRILLSLVLLSAGALTLLLSDLRSREGTRSRASARVEKEAIPSGRTAVPRPTDRQFKIGLVYFGPEEGSDSAIAGLMDGLRKLGLVEGRNLTVQKMHANGEISAIPAVLQSLDASSVDVIVPFSTPVLTAACAGVRRKPVVFTYCSDPIAAGAGRSFEDHLPFVTGIGSFPPVAEALGMLKLTFPKFKRPGTLYNNAEANSVKVVSVLRDLCARSLLRFVSRKKSLTPSTRSSQRVGMIEENSPLLFSPLRALRTLREIFSR